MAVWDGMYQVHTAANAHFTAKKGQGSGEESRDIRSSNDVEYALLMEVLIGYTSKMLIRKKAGASYALYFEHILLRRVQSLYVRAFGIYSICQAIRI